jgi:hypothetical protein
MAVSAPAMAASSGAHDPFGRSSEPRRDVDVQRRPPKSVTSTLDAVRGSATAGSCLGPFERARRSVSGAGRSDAIFGSSGTTFGALAEGAATAATFGAGRGGVGRFGRAALGTALVAPEGVPRRAPLGNSMKYAVPIPSPTSTNAADMRANRIGPRWPISFPRASAFFRLSSSRFRRCERLYRCR